MPSHITMTDHSSSSSAETQSLTSTTTTATRLSLKRRISLSLHRSRNHSSAPKPPNRGLGHSIHRITTAAGAPINKAVNLLGAEGFMPQTMDRECAKASRILHAFTDDPGPAPASSYKAPSHPLGLSVKSMVTIPHKVLANCSGLAVFNTLRAGAYMGSLAAGSGIVVARRPDGTWSPPSSFVVSTLGAGFMIGLDIYDCVLVLNTPAQVAAFAHPRVSLGAESSVAIGPVGTGGAVEAALSKTGRPMFSYIKSRGFWAGVQIDGTIILARQDCNGVAYQNRRISAKKILTLQAEWPEGSQPLWQTLMAMEGRYAIDPDIAREMAAMGPPGDLTPPATGYMTPSSLPPPLEEDEEDEDGPAPPYAASVASEWRYDGSEEGVTQEPIVEEKERLGRAGY